MLGLTGDAMASNGQNFPHSKNYEKLSKEISLLPCEDIKLLLKASTDQGNYIAFKTILECRNKQRILITDLEILNHFENDRSFIFQAIREEKIETDELFLLVDQALTMESKQIFESLFSECPNNIKYELLAHLVKFGNRNSHEIIITYSLNDSSGFLRDALCQLVSGILSFRKYQWEANGFVEQVFKHMQQLGSEEFSLFLGKIIPNPKETHIWQKMTISEATILAWYCLEHGIYDTEVFISIVETSPIMNGSQKIVGEEIFQKTLSKYFELKQFANAKKIILSHASSRLISTLKVIPNEIFRKLIAEENFVSSMIRKCTLNNAEYVASRFLSLGIRKIPEFPVSTTPIPILGFFLKDFDFSELSESEAIEVFDHLDYFDSDVIIKFFDSLKCQSFWNYLNFQKTYRTVLKKDFSLPRPPTLDLDLVEKLIASDRIELLSFFVLKKPTLIKELLTISDRKMNTWAYALWKSPNYKILPDSTPNAVSNFIALLESSLAFKEFIFTTIEEASKEQLEKVEIEKYANFAQDSRYESCISRLCKEAAENDEEAFRNLAFLMTRVHAPLQFIEEFHSLNQNQKKANAEEFKKYSERLQKCDICLLEYEPKLTAHDFKEKTQQCSENFHYFHRECVMHLNSVKNKILCPVCRCPMRKEKQ